MSRSVCTNSSSIVVMSFEKKPMTFILSWCNRDQLGCHRASTGNVQSRRGVPANRQINSIRMPECRAADVGTRRNSSADLMQAPDESVPIGWLIGHAVASLVNEAKEKRPAAPTPAVLRG